MPKSNLRRAALCLLAPVPALAVGVLVMRASGVPTALWGQNVAAWTVGALLCLVLSRRPRTTGPRWTWAALVAAVTLAALAATLLAPGVDGVHRWLELGPLRIHAAAVLLPCLLVALDALARLRGWWTSALVAAAVALALWMQPDAAQATAFAAGAVVLLLPRSGGGALRWLGLLVLPVLAVLAWLRRDPLAPVRYVEEIVGMAAEMGAAWALAAGIALLLLPAPFFFGGRGAAPRVGLALGAYVAVTVLAPFVGSFPVPVMGFGMSPILGYLLALGIFLRSAASGDERALRNTHPPDRSSVRAA